MVLKKLLTVLTLSVFLVTCSPQPEIKPIPEFIIQKGNQFVISKVGNEYFNKYIKYNPSKSRYENNSYWMVYSFVIPDKSFVNESFWFYLDIDGNFFGLQPGIPDLIKNPQEGDFLIDEQTAIDIAKKAGLEEGIKKWKTSFHWYHGNLQTFVWTVQNTLRESSGKIIVIDANDGKILMQNDWRQIP